MVITEHGQLTVATAERCTPLPQHTFPTVSGVWGGPPKPLERQISSH